MIYYSFKRFVIFFFFRYVVLFVDFLGISGIGLFVIEFFRILLRVFLKICLKKNDIEFVLF